jgi:hypothetical protein
MLHPEDYRPPQQEQAEAQAEEQVLVRDRLQRAQQRKRKRVERQPQPPQAPLTSGCHEMDTITADQLKCVYPMLDHERAFEYATAASATLGSLLGTTCAWAAFLGNAGVLSKEMTSWRETKCLTEPPYCGRGPLQITSYSSYDFCSAQPSCDCPNIADEIEAVSDSSHIGFGTAACIWGDLFGTSLSTFADGSREGFLRTACAIHQGKYPCDAVFPEGKPYEKRESYWRKASECLGVRPSRENEFLQGPSPSRDGRMKPSRKEALTRLEGPKQPKHRADTFAKVAALAATMEAAEAEVADRRRSLELQGFEGRDLQFLLPRDRKKKKPPEVDMVRRDAAGAKLGKVVAKLTKVAAKPATAAAAKQLVATKPAKAAAKPVKAAAKPVKAVTKPVKTVTKPVKTAAKAAKAVAAVSAKSVVVAAPAETATDEASEYAIEPDDPQLMAKLKAHLRAKDMQTEQFAMVQKALKELASHQEDRADQGKPPAGTLQP